MDSLQKQRLLEQMMDESVFKKMVEKTFTDADLDQSGFIEQQEFAALLKGIHSTLGRPPPTEEEIREELKRLDINKDGKLDKKEFETLVKDLVNFCVETL